MNIIRTAHKKDIEEIYSLLNNTKELRDFNEGEEYPISWVKNLISHKKENIVLVSEVDKNFAGFLVAHLLRSVGDAILNNLYIKKDYRNRMIASQLLKEYEKQIRREGFRYSMAFSQVDNKIVHSFNEKNGYKKGGIFHSYYKWIN